MNKIIVIISACYVVSLYSSVVLAQNETLTPAERQDIQARVNECHSVSTDPDLREAAVRCGSACRGVTRNPRMIRVTGGLQSYIDKCDARYAEFKVLFDQKKTTEAVTTERSMPDLVGFFSMRRGKPMVSSRDRLDFNTHCSRQFVMKNSGDNQKLKQLKSSTRVRLIGIHWVTDQSGHRISDCIVSKFEVLDNRWMVLFACNSIAEFRDYCNVRWLIDP